MTKNYWILLAQAIMLFLINIDYGAANLAIVTIASEFASPITLMQWVLSAYVVGWGMFLIPAGRLSELYGLRRICLFGLSLFALSSLLAGMAPAAYILILSRLLKGVGGALVVPTLYALTYTNFPEDMRGFAVGIVSLAVGVGAAFGPSLGAFFIEYTTWRWIFLLNVPLCCFAGSIIFMILPKEPSKCLDEPFDWLGMIFINICVASIILTMKYAFSLQGWILLVMLIIASCTGLFVKQQAKSEFPLLDLTLFFNRMFMASNITFAIQQYHFATFSFLISIYMQQSLHLDAYTAGTIFLLTTVTFSVVSPIAGRLSDKFDIRLPIGVGYAFIIIADALIIELMRFQGNLYLYTLMLCMGIGMGGTFSALNTAMLHAVEDDKISSASGLLTTWALLANSIGIVLTSLYLEHQLALGLPLPYVLSHIFTVNIGLGLVGFVINYLWIKKPLRFGFPLHR